MPVNGALATWLCLYTNFSTDLCRIPLFWHKNNGCFRCKFCTKVMYYNIFLVVYIYYKCTNWLQYKDSFKQIPFGTTIWIIEQIRDILVKLLYQGQRQRPVNILTWWVPSLIRNKSAITCISFSLNNIHSIRQEPLLPSEQTHPNTVKDDNKCLLGRNTSHNTGRISAQQFQCSTMMSGGEWAPGFPLRINKSIYISFFLHQLFSQDFRRKKKKKLPGWHGNHVRILFSIMLTTTLRMAQIRCKEGGKWFKRVSHLKRELLRIEESWQIVDFSAFEIVWF